ncbi:MAG: hypothetical protein LBK06_01205 [Planctomycetaceae bacterium]|jgi:hypothetical protein|nr:hypothetical protein [Planctomycetaceae bacterium]
MKRIFVVAVLFIVGAFGNFYCQADWTAVGSVNGTQVYRDNWTGLEWTTTLGRVKSSDWGSSAQGTVAQYGFRLPSFYELQQMERHGGFARLNIRSSLGNYYETSNPNYLANAAVNGFQTPQARKGSGYNWVIGVRESQESDVVVVTEQQVSVSPVQSTSSTSSTSSTTVSTTAIKTASNVDDTTVVTSIPTSIKSETNGSAASAGCPPNPIAMSAPFASVATIKSIQAAVKEKLEEQIELVREILSESNFSNESISAKLKEKNASAANQSAMITAIDDGDTTTVQRIWIEVVGDVKEAGQLSRMVKFLSELSEFEKSIDDKEIEAGGFKNIRKAFEKIKLGNEIEKKLKPVITSIALIAEVNELLAALKLPKGLQVLDDGAIYLPEDEVTIIINPKQNPNDIFAVNESMFIVGQKEKTFDVIKGTLDDFVPKLPDAAESQITSQDAGNQVTLSNPASNTESVNFNLTKDAVTLASGATQSYPFPPNGQITINVTKTRLVTTGRRRQLPQKYKDTQTANIAAGVTYDFQVDGDKNVKIVPRPVSITLDNSKGTVGFNLLVDGRLETIEPSGTKTFTADDGILNIQFARSEDINDTASLNFYQSITIKPAISTKDGKWALFPAK